MMGLGAAAAPMVPGRQATGLPSEVVSNGAAPV
jgi:hypothetical protein